LDRMESVEQRVPLLSLERPSYIDVYRDDGVFPQDGRDSQAAMQDAATTSFPSHGTGEIASRDAAQPSRSASSSQNIHHQFRSMASSMEDLHAATAPSTPRLSTRPPSVRRGSFDFRPPRSSLDRQFGPYPFRANLAKVGELVMRPVKTKLSVELIIHILIAFATLVSVMLWSGHHLAYMRENRQMVTHMVMSGPCVEIKLFKELRECIKQTGAKFQALGRYSLNPIHMKGMWPEDTNAIARLDVLTMADNGQVFNASASSYSLKADWDYYYLTDDNLPFGTSPLATQKEALYELVTVRLNIRYMDINFYNTQRVCLIWNLHISYDILAASGILTPQLTIKQQNCNRPQANSSTMIVNLVIMVFALLSLSLAVHSCVLSMPFVARWRERRRARRRLSAARDDAPLVELELENDTASKAVASEPLTQTNPRYERQPVSTRYEMPRSETTRSLPGGVELHSDLTPIKAWWLFCAVGNCLQFCNSAVIVVYGRPTGDSFAMSLMGMGGIIAWVNLVRYFEFSPRFYVLVLTLERSMPDILRFVASCLPVLLGFATMGMAVFGSTVPEFATLHSTFETLFALMNGDSVLQLLQEGDSVPITGTVYVTVFMLMFVCAIMNICITIVMHSYETVTGHQGQCLSLDHATNRERFGSGLSVRSRGWDHSPGCMFVPKNNGNIEVELA